VAPFGSQPAVVEVEPSDHGTNVESTVDRVELERRTGDLGTVGNDGSRDDGPKELGALLEPQALKTATKSVEENPSRGVKLSNAIVSVVS
jgi:hypothetical protein